MPKSRPCEGAILLGEFCRNYVGGARALAKDVLLCDESLICRFISGERVPHIGWREQFRRHCGIPLTAWPELKVVKPATYVPMGGKR